MRARAFRTGVAIKPQLVEMDQRRRHDAALRALEDVLMQFDCVAVLAHDERAERVFDRTQDVAGFEIAGVLADCHCFFSRRFQRVPGIPATATA